MRSLHMQCQESFELLKTSLVTDPLLTYPDPNLPYVLFTDASKYASACVLTQEKTHILEGKETNLLHPITYMSGLFRGSQLNWACLTKEAYTFYMSIKTLTYYLEDADVTLRSDHLPLKKFLAKKTLNSKVNNWAIEVSPFRIILNTLKEINHPSTYHEQIDRDRLSSTERTRARGLCVWLLCF